MPMSSVWVQFLLVRLVSTPPNGWYLKVRSAGNVAMQIPCQVIALAFPGQHPAQIQCAFVKIPV